MHQPDKRSTKLALVSLMAFVLFAAACSDLEKNAYRVLAVTQAEYETLQDKAAESAARNLISEQQWERFQVLGHRFIAAHNFAVDAFALWSKSKQPADTARLQAMLDLLPGLIADINALVQSFSAPNLVPQLSPNGTTIPVPADPAVQPQIDRPSDPESRPVRIIPGHGNHGDRLLRRGSVFSSAIARQLYRADVRARFQPCRNSAKEQRASAPEAYFVSGRIPSIHQVPVSLFYSGSRGDRFSHRGLVPSSVHQPPTAVIPRSECDEGSALLLTSIS